MPGKYFHFENLGHCSVEVVGDSNQQSKEKHHVKINCSLFLGGYFIEHPVCFEKTTRSTQSPSTAEAAAPILHFTIVKSSKQDIPEGQT